MQGKKQVEKKISALSKAEARESFRTYQRAIALVFIASAAFGVYLLSTDLSLWILAVSHAYGLIAICVIDIILAVANFKSIRKALLPSTIWAGLTIILQLGDILTAPQYKMTMQYFASYLFGLWAYDALVAVQVVAIVLTLSARRYAKLTAKKKKITYFDMGFKKSRRDFIQITSAIVGLVALTGLLGALDTISNNNKGNGGSSTTNNGNLPSGAIANVNNMQVGNPVYFQYPSQGYPNVLVKKADGTLVALSLLCTHACCQCSYDPGSTQLYCPCHGSIFDQGGGVLRGPASAPLPSVELNVDGSGNVFPIKFNGSSPCLSG